MPSADNTVVELVSPDAGDDALSVSVPAGAPVDPETGADIGAVLAPGAAVVLGPFDTLAVVVVVVVAVGDGGTAVVGAPGDGARVVVELAVVGLGAGVGTGVGPGVGFGVGLGVGFGVGLGVGLGVGDGVGGTGVGAGVGEGVGATTTSGFVPNV